jgi:isoleucyl-tRNA synthetase
MPFSTACKTPLSNFEANLNYNDVSDPSVLISFPFIKPLKGKEVSAVVWTTTPWTLPANCALAVNKDFKYDIFEYKGKYYLMHCNRISEYFKDYKVVDNLLGSDLIDLEYSQQFDFYEDLRSKKFFRVIFGDFVSGINGTAIVHCAPAFGEEDYKAFVINGLIRKNEDVPCPVDENGNFTLGKFKGIYVKDLKKNFLRTFMTEF